MSSFLIFFLEYNIDTIQLYSRQHHSSSSAINTLLLSVPFKPIFGLFCYCTLYASLVVVLIFFPSSIRWITQLFFMNKFSVMTIVFDRIFEGIAPGDESIATLRVLCTVGDFYAYLILPDGQLTCTHYQSQATSYSMFFIIMGDVDGCCVRSSRAEIDVMRCIRIRLFIKQKHTTMYRIPHTVYQFYIQ